MTPQEQAQIATLLQAFGDSLQSLLTISGSAARNVLEKIRSDIDDLLTLPDPRGGDQGNRGVGGALLIEKSQRLRKQARELRSNDAFERDSMASALGCATGRIESAPQIDNAAAALGVSATMTRRVSTVRKSDGADRDRHLSGLYL